MNGQPVRASMGVVVQAMVAAEAAGVAFSRDPMTGDPSKVVVTANYGLGEVTIVVPTYNNEVSLSKVYYIFEQSVVSALSEPDTVVVRYQPWKKAAEEEVWTIGEASPGSKRKKIVMASGKDQVCKCFKNTQYPILTNRFGKNKTT